MVFIYVEGNIVKNNYLCFVVSLCAIKFRELLLLMNRQRVVKNAKRISSNV